MNAHDFKPPKDNALAIAFLKLLLPLVLKYRMGDATLEVVGDGKTRFAELKGKRTVICPNHSAEHDCEVMFALSNIVGEDFNYLAAREIFDYNHGWNGFWLQRLGVYSVVRGAVDRESFRTTKELIVTGRRKLVIFPEGEISRQNDTLMPLESGVAQLCFWAADELKRRGQDGEPVYILPLAIKYTYRSDIRDELEKSLFRLEDYLGLKSEFTDSLYGRLRAVSENILGTMETEYGQRLGKDASMNDRIDGLRSLILKNMAAYLQVNLPDSKSQLDWVRILRNALDDFIYAEGQDSSAYQRKIHEEKAAKIKSFYKDLDRVVNFIAIYDGYLRDRLTQERFADVINRFEAEVFGTSTIKGPRLVRIQVGTPIDLAARFDDYKDNKRDAIRQVNCEMEEQISGMLVELEESRSPVFL